MIPRQTDPASASLNTRWAQSCPRYLQHRKVTLRLVEGKAGSAPVQLHACLGTANPIFPSLAHKTRLQDATMRVAMQAGQQGVGRQRRISPCSPF